jgi:branched-chain amino acid transport system substrate-binding protein
MAAEETSRFEPVVVPTPNGIGAEEALAAAESLVRDPRVLAVIGHSNSAASLAASQVYNSAGVVQIAPSSTAPVYDEAGPYSFRMVPSDTAQARFIADALRDWSRAQRVALVYVNDDYGRGLRAALRPHLDSLVYEGIYSDVADSMHVHGVGEQLVASRPEAIIWLGRPRRLRMILQELRAALPGVLVLCSDACDDVAVYAGGPPDYDSLRFVRFVDPAATDTAMQRFQAQLQARTGVVGSVEAVMTYDAARVLAAAIAEGARTREDVRRYLESLGDTRPAFAGITGPIAFDDAGSIVRDYQLAIIEGNRVLPLEPTRRP